MTDREQRAAAKAFAEFWKGKGYEKGESQLFWTSLLRDVFGVEKPEQTRSYKFYRRGDSFDKSFD